MRSLFMPLALCASLPVFAQSQSLVVCSEAAPEGFDIVQYTAATTADASAETVYERLVQFAPGSTRIIPALAESWEISADGLTYTFTLRKGVKFHQTPWFTPSRELNADDVLWSFQRQRDKDHDWHELAPRGFPYFEAMGFTSIYSAEYAEQLLDAETPEKLNSQPIGTGPFVFERYAKDAQVRFAGNPHYWGGKPALDRLLLAITPDPNTRIQQLKAGACQVALFPRPSDVPALREHKDLQVLELDSLLTAYVAINTRHKPLDDVRVRQAINLAFDRQAYLRAQYGEGNASLAAAPYPATLLGHDERLQPWPKDLERARQLLAEAGHAKGLKLSIWTRPGGGPTNPNPGIGAQMLQADLAAIGIQADIRVFEWGELIKRAKNGEHDLVFMGWAGDNGDPDNFLTPNLSCAAAASGENQAGWCHKEFDLLIREARRVAEPERRAALYREALAIFHQQAPWIALAHPKQFAVLRKDVEGFVLSPLGSNNFTHVKRKQ